MERSITMKAPNFFKLLFVLSISTISLVAILALLNMMSVAAQGPAAGEAKSDQARPANHKASLASAINFCEAIRPGQPATVTDGPDPITDTVDFIEATSTLSGQQLTATLTFWDLLSQSEQGIGTLYFWEIYIDADNSLYDANRLPTGLDFGDTDFDSRTGADYVISIYQDDNSSQAEIWRLGRNSYDILTRPVTWTIDANANMITVSALITDTGLITGITPDSRLVFWAEDWSDNFDDSDEIDDDYEFDDFYFDQDEIECANPDGVFDSADFSLFPNNFAAAISITNSFLEVDVGNMGKFVVGTTGGNRDIISDTNMPLTFGFEPEGASYPGTSFVSARIDGLDLSLKDVMPDFDPIENNQKIVTTWTLDSDIQLTQTLSFMENPFTGYTDTVKIEYEVANSDTIAHEIGLRYLLDTMIGGNDDAPFFVPEVGNLDIEQEFPGFFEDPYDPGYFIDINYVPTHFEAFEDKDFGDDSLKALAILDPLLLEDYSQTNLNPPDRFVIANWSELFDTVWEYEPYVGEPHGDSAVAIYWGFNNPIILGSGETQRFAMAYGLPATEVGVDEDPDWLDAPVEATLPENQDVITFTITYWVVNTGTVDLEYDPDIPVDLFSGGSIELVPQENLQARQELQEETQQGRRRKVTKKRAAGRRVTARYRRGGGRSLVDSPTTDVVTYTLSYSFTNTTGQIIYMTETNAITIQLEGAKKFIYLPFIAKNQN